MEANRWDKQGERHATMETLKSVLFKVFNSKDREEELKNLQKPVI